MFSVMITDVLPSTVSVFWWYVVPESAQVTWTWCADRKS